MANAKTNQATTGHDTSGALQTRQPQNVQRRSSLDPTAALTSGLQDLIDPFSFIRRIYDDMDRMLMQPRNRNSGGRASQDILSVWAPAIEVAERDGKYVISAELPGVNEDSVRVEVTDQAVIIEGERTAEHEASNGGVYRSERVYGHFYRAIPLPESAQADATEARFNNGVLEITVPLSESSRKQIPIQSGQNHEAQGTGSSTPSKAESRTGGDRANRSETTKAA